MKNKKAFAIILNLILHFLGFPILMIVAIVKSAKWNEFGMYGVSAFTPLFIVLGLWVFVWAVQATIYFMAKKKGKSAGITVFKQILVPVLIIVILLGVLDIALPKPLKNGTENTILYEDVIDDYQGLHETLLNKVELFKIKNGISKDVKYNDKAFQDVFKPVFSSMQKAYNSYDKLAIEYALLGGDMFQNIKSGKVPISVAATLLLKTAPGNENDHNLSIGEIVGTNIVKIEKAISDLQAINFDFTNTRKLNEIVNDLIVTKNFDGITWNIFNMLGKNPLFGDVDPNAAIVANAGETNEKTYSVFGYQDMSWLNGLNQMFFIPYMSMRPIIYLYAGLMVVITYLQYVLKTILYKNEDKTEKTDCELQLESQ